jgi:hypothetical protein
VAIPQKGNCVLVEPDLISGKSRQHSRKLWGLQRIALISVSGKSESQLCWFQPELEAKRTEGAWSWLLKLAKWLLIFLRNYLPCWQIYIGFYAAFPCPTHIYALYSFYQGPITSRWEHCIIGIKSSVYFVTFWL